MTNPTLEAVSNVLSGMSAHGVPIDMNRLWFPNSGHALVTLNGAACAMVEILDDEVDTDERLTALLRKLVAYAARRGADARQRLLETDAARAASYLRQRPHLITSTMAFAGIVKLATQPEAAAARGRQLLQDMREKYQLPPLIPRSCIWRSADRRFGLFELTHPKHVWEAGRHFHNCLSTHFVDGYDEVSYSLGLMDSLPFLAYWQKMAKGRLRIFTFHEFHEPQVVMSVDRHRLCEMQFLRSDDALLRGLGEAMAELSGRLEPSGLDLRWLTLPQVLTEELSRRLGYVPGPRPPMTFGDMT